ncbi:TSL-kinase interacting protein 1 [Dorcoceras hygrometricum]|uniref:TSL-kinase interacting protein 1 n=1 Tax=Dorcoceras hygrometricum TaxID=472368 RepID=A0A2Z7AYL5_9LAMI|nr:TSL-kinase interacting protein 1 [Dorcoceras hygrometricum]
MVSQVSLDCETLLVPENLGSDGGDSTVPPSTQDQTAAPVPVKRQTRQWAAWTRQEEESFFAGLRQVGKASNLLKYSCSQNFEKITCRVQSKNKDQVRHYYYRLVRRMNKLLGPELSLDAKNSKDTNAAMLRWWSLLEKYSCKASKLHLKPRRFKIFLETLGNQLLKDRKRNIKKRLSDGENHSSTTYVPVSNEVRTSGHDNRAVKLVLVDSQNIQKVGNGKGSLLKRHVNSDMMNRAKVEPNSVKVAKHRRKTGIASAAAYKRWETAAIAGVSLVADAAEHLERVNSNKDVEIGRETPGHDGSQQVVEMVNTLPVSSQTLFNENNIQNSAKLKLQLFPIDENTRKTLETEQHNPHLELTLSARKKISSVLEHLSRKWGNSSFMDQELMLFPYWAQPENLVGYQRWTKDSPLCAADIYHLIGKPQIFRLRYGWFLKAEVESETAQTLSCLNLSEQMLNINLAKEQDFQTDFHDCQLASKRQRNDHIPSSACALNETPECRGSISDVNISRYHSDAVDMSMPGRETGVSTVTRQVEKTKDVTLSSGEWADSLTNISVGDLLSETTQNKDINCSEFPVPINSYCHSQIPFSCDSFDAAIAAHIYKNKNKLDVQPKLQSHVPSIWDAEETCDAFAFQKKGPSSDIHSASKNDSPELGVQATEGNLASYKEVEELPGVEKLTSTNPASEDLIGNCRPDYTSENGTKDIGGITDVYWPDSLGPLDLDIPTCRYHSDDLIFSDSLGGLSRLVASSLDVFQNCSLFGLDKKELAPAAETRQNASISDFKIGSEV